MSDDDDEIVIDFSKIKDKFKSVLGNKDKTTKDELNKGEARKDKTKEEKVEEVKAEQEERDKEDKMSEEEEKEEVKESKEDKKKELADEKSEDSDKEDIIDNKDRKMEKKGIDDDKTDEDDEIVLDFSKFKSFLKKKDEKEQRETKEARKEVRREKTEQRDDEEEVSIDTQKAMGFIGKYWQYIALIIIIIFVIYMRSQVSYAPVTEDWARNSVENFIKNQIRAEINAQNPNLPEQNKQMLVNQQFSEIVKAQKEPIEAQIKELSKEYKKAISYEYEGNNYVYLGDIDSYYWMRFARNVLNNGHICDEIKDGECWDNLAVAPLGRKDVPHIHPYMIAFTYKAAPLTGNKIPLMQASLITPTIIAIFTAIAAYFVGYLLIGKIGGLLTAIFVSCNTVYVNRSIGSDNDIYTLLFPLIVLSFLFLAIKLKSRKGYILSALVAGLFVGLFKFAWEHGWWNIFNTVIYAFVLFIGFLIIHQLYTHKNIHKIISNETFRRVIVISVFFYIGGFIGFFLVTTITGASVGEYFIAPFEGPLDFIKFSKSAVNVNVWPNVRTTVAEFNPISLSRIPNQLFLGKLGNFIFFLAIMGIFLLFIKEIESKKTKYIMTSFSVIAAIFFSSKYVMENLSRTTYFALFSIIAFSYLIYFIYKKVKFDNIKMYHITIGIMLIIWFVGTLYAATQGIRFTLIVVPSISIAIAYGLATVYEEIVNFFKDADLSFNINIIKIIMLIVVLIIPISVASTSLSVTKSFVPHYNAAWDDALLKIRDESQPDAIVNSWWDFGHWFKYTTERGVTLDGATQNSPQLHWLGKLLLTDSEKESRGILRMLDCGGNTAFDVIENTTNDIPVAVDILNQIILLDDKEEVKEILRSYDIPEEDLDRVLEYSHCDPPENYLITSDDMIGKSGVWAHFGSWDFYRAEIASMRLIGKNRQWIIENLTSRDYRDTTSEGVVQLYSDLMKRTNNEQINAWIAPWPSFAGDVGCNRKPNSSVFVCDNGVNFDEASKECFVNTPEGTRYPKKCLYVDGDETVLKEYNESILNIQGRVLGVAFLPQGTNNLRSIMMDSELTGSMFTRLYFFKGHGMKYFDLFDDRQSPLGAKILTWKVDWQGESKNLVYHTTTETVYETASPTVE